MELTTANKPALIGTKKNAAPLLIPPQNLLPGRCMVRHTDATGVKTAIHACQPLQTMIACGLPLS
jgi:hypothetical protein